MREKIYYMLAIAVLLVAISALVVVFGQNQPLTSQPAQQSSAASLQSMFTTLANRVNQDANFAFRIRVAATSNGSTITVGKGGAKITDVGSDFFCLANTPPAKVCYPYAQLLAVAL